VTADHVFCIHHIATEENPAGTDCSAHMIEARVFACPYTSIEDAKADKCPCEDAEEFTGDKEVDHGHH